MKLSKLKEASNSDFRNFLEKRYDLTQYQWNKMYDDDFPKNSPFFIYTYEKIKNGGLLWRLTLPLIIPYYISMIFYVLIKWLVTGDRYFKEDTFILKFHRMWMRKLGIDWL